MQKSLFAALLIGGAGVAVWGVTTMNSIGSDVSQVVTGAPPKKTMYLLIGGSAAAAAGLFGLLFGHKSK